MIKLNPQIHFFKITKIRDKIVNKLQKYPWNIFSDVERKYEIALCDFILLDSYIQLIERRSIFKIWFNFQWTKYTVPI